MSRLLSLLWITKFVTIDPSFLLFLLLHRFLYVFYGTKRNSYCIWKEYWPEISYPYIHKFLSLAYKGDFFFFYIEMQQMKKKKFLGMKFIIIILSNKKQNNKIFCSILKRSYFLLLFALLYSFFCMYNFIMLDFWMPLWGFFQKV